ncbi:MAG TPA: hypothetical protein VF933_03010 [Streptosporangiaceae bacterium]
MTEPKRAIDGDGDGAGNPGPQRPAAARFWRDVERGLSLAQLTVVLPVFVLVCAVTFTGVLLEFGRNELDILYLAAGVAIFIVALTVFLRFGSDNGGDHA